MNHTVERRTDKLRVTIEIPLTDGLGAAFADDLTRYLGRVARDIHEVFALLIEEDEEGAVKWFDDAKGWGFIWTHDGQEAFVHHRHIVTDEPWKTLAEGQRVRFKRRVGRPRGPQQLATLEAVDVKPL